jgi:hypothetical protein
MLASVIEIDDLHGPREVLVSQVPDPFGPIAQTILNIWPGHF